MSRYIDADMLEKDGWNMQRIRQASATEMIYETKKPTDFPAADVQEVRHGHWIEDRTEPLGYRCSVCGKGMCRFDFCPYCGAKMDEVSKDE